MADLALQMTVTGLVMGLIYVLIALGVTLIFGIMRVVNFVHGEMLMLSAFSVYYMAGQWGLRFPVALLASVVVVCVLGVVCQRLLYRPLHYDILNCFIIAVGASFAFRSAAWITFGPVPRNIPSLSPGVVRVGSAFVSGDRLIAAGVSLALIAALYLFLKHARAGKSMRAVEQDSEASLLMGIHIDRIYVLAFVISSALAAVAGALVGMLFAVEPEMGAEPLLKSFIIVQIGGMGSVAGAVIAGLFIGLADSFTETLLGGELAFIIDFAILMILLVVRPRGLFGYDV